MAINFNEISQNIEKTKEAPEKKEGHRYGEDALKRAVRTGERTRFIAKPNPMTERDYEVFEYDFKKGEYKHVGDYVLINKKEPREATEIKVQNLMNSLNKKNEITDVSNLTKTRMLYTMVPEAQAGDQTKIIFKDYDGLGVSKDNAIFTIRKGVIG